MKYARHVVPTAFLAVVASTRTLTSQTTAPARLDSVSIVASRAVPGGAGRTVDVIDRDAIAHSPARNLAELLGARMSLDAYTRSAAQADVSIRGSTAEQVLILVDGVRMGDAQSAHYALDVGIPLSSIQRVEILRGAGSALYGPNAIGGVINIVTRSGPTSAVPDGSRGETNLRAGSFGTVGLGGFTGASTGATSLTSSFQVDRSDGHRSDTDYRIAQTRFTAAHAAGGGTLTADASIGVRDFGAADFYSPYNSSERTGTVTGGTRWTGALDDWSLTGSMHTRLHTDRFTLVRDKPAIYENRHRSWQTGVDGSARKAIGADGVIVLGAEAEHDQLSSARLGGRREWRGAAFVEGATTFARKLNVNVGARDDHSTVYGDFLSPSVSASTPVITDFVIRASGGRGFRAPTWTERYYTDPGNRGNPSLTPERFWTGEIGAHYTPQAAKAVGLVLDLAGFVRRADGLIDWVRPAGQTASAWQAANIGTGHFRGVEGSVSATPVARMQLSLSGSQLSFEDASAPGLTGKYALRPITGQLIAAASVPVAKKIDASVSVQYARRALEEGYTAVNGRTRWSLGWARVLLDVTNLTNSSWVDATGQIAQGRAVFVGLER